MLKVIFLAAIFIHTIGAMQKRLLPEIVFMPTSVARDCSVLSQVELHEFKTINPNSTTITQDLEQTKKRKLIVARYSEFLNKESGAIKKLIDRNIFLENSIKTLSPSSKEVAYFWKQINDNNQLINSFHTRNKFFKDVLGALNCIFPSKDNVNGHKRKLEDGLESRRKRWKQEEVAAGTKRKYDQGLEEQKIKKIRINLQNTGSPFLIKLGKMLQGKIVVTERTQAFDNSQSSINLSPNNNLSSEVRSILEKQLQERRKRLDDCKISLSTVTGDRLQVVIDEIIALEIDIQDLEEQINTSK